MKIAIIQNPTSPLSTVFGPKEIFELAILQARNNASLTVIRSEEIIAVDECQYDLIIISALGMLSEHKGFKAQPIVVSWLQNQHKEGAILASICTGAFLLAATGLLDNKTASTHWLVAPLFRKLFPKVKLEVEQMVNQNGPLWSSGGAFAYQDLCLSLVSEVFGRRVADYCASILMLSPVRESQQAFMTLQAYHLHGDKKIDGIQQHLESNFIHSPSIAKLADQYAISERQLLRRFKTATGVSPNSYLQILRIEFAKRQFLENPDASVQQVANKAGYEDVAYFRKLFKQQVNVTPSEFRDRYN